eukprot:GSChrysophyteH1.ASY1.ANO1.1478.1 assembled CDS
MQANSEYPVIAPESIMSSKAHGTCENPVQKGLKYGIEFDLADRICCFNRHYAESSGSWTSTSFLREVDRSKETTFYDSVSGFPLFVAPRGRTFEDFEKESRAHGWPSFRDEEVCVSLWGTHLGHNLPDGSGNRYCINLCSVAGNPVDSKSDET